MRESTPELMLYQNIQLPVFAIAYKLNPYYHFAKQNSHSIC